MTQSTLTLRLMSNAPAIPQTDARISHPPDRNAPQVQA